MQSADTASFLAFHQRWAEVQGWKVPEFHIRMCIWLVEERASDRVMMVFRGASKSTNYGVYKAWKLWRNRAHRSLVWSADGPTAGMLTADTINVLRNHPWCRGVLPPRPSAKKFWVNGARDARNPSMRAVGVDSNATGARADDVDFDDVEVPGNIETPEARLRLRQRINESTHIAVPGAQKTYIGTPHTHDSIYPEQIKGGAAVLKIPLFAHARRFTDTSTRHAYPLPFKPGPDGLYVFAGIGKTARLMVEGVDYKVVLGKLLFSKPPGVVIDVCAGCAWPERFNRIELEKRRKNTLTLNGWDSQYMLEAKPISEVRLDPTRIPVYADEPTIRYANGQVAMWLDDVRIVGASVKWDPSSGKLKSDSSSLAVVLQDEQGRRYWHRSIDLQGEVVKLDDAGEKIIGGQVLQIVDTVVELSLPRVVVETNGAGTFAPQHLKAALTQARKAGRLKHPVGVTEKHETQNKNRRILDALEGPITSAALWAHITVRDGPAFPQMRDWNPAITEQPDDHLDSLAGAVTETPERISRAAYSDGWNPPSTHEEDWRPSAGVHEIELES